MPIILSDTIKVKYKIDTKGRNTVEMAKLLRDYGVKGFLYSVNPRSVVMAVLPEDVMAVLKEFRKLIDYKLTLHQGSSMYREYRSKLDQLGVK